MTDEESITKFPPVVGIPPIKSSDYNLMAISRVLDFRVRLWDNIDLYKITDEDLTSDELSRRQQYVHDIISWLKGCGKELAGFALAPHLFSPLGSSAMSRLQELLKGAYDRKIERAKKVKEEEQKKPPRPKRHGVSRVLRQLFDFAK